MPSQLRSEASCCRKLAAKLKRKEEKRLMLKVARAFEELSARRAEAAAAAAASGSPQATANDPAGAEPAPAAMPMTQRIR